jgi:hypothetical protein
MYLWVILVELKASWKESWSEVMKRIELSSSIRSQRTRILTRVGLTSLDRLGVCVELVNCETPYQYGSLGVCRSKS